MVIFSYIDEFFDIINDPRNISPDTFAQFYPDEANPKSLSHSELAAHFENLNSFKRPINWTGYKPLFPKIVAILEMADNLGQKELIAAFTYFASRARENELFQADFWVNDGLLQKDSIALLVSMFGAFHKNIQLEVLFQLQGLLNAQEEVQVQIIENPYPDIFTPEGYQIFKSWIPKIRKHRKKLQDSTYIFHTLKQANLMYNLVRPVDFIKILNEHDVDTDQLVTTRYNVTDQNELFIIP